MLMLHKRVNAKMQRVMSIKGQAFYLQKSFHGTVRCQPISCCPFSISVKLKLKNIYSSLAKASQFIFSNADERKKNQPQC